MKILSLCRIPHHYFITKGQGESDITIHAGSYHLALKNAGIEKQNIMTYSSIIPPTAKEISKSESKNLYPGSVCETIMATANGNAGETIGAGIIFGWVYDKEKNKKIIGLVCEHNGIYKDRQELTIKLQNSLQELYCNGFEKYELCDIECHTNFMKVQKTYGTVIVAICFTDYIFRIIPFWKR